MRLTPKFNFLFAIFSLFCLSSPQVAWACSCMSSAFSGFLSPDGDIPSNARGILWSGEVEGFQVQILNSQGQNIAFEAEKVKMGFFETEFWLFRPRGGFKKQEDYIFKSQNGSNEAVFSVSVSPTPVLQQPKSLPLKIRASYQQKVSVAADISCHTSLTASLYPIEMVLPPEYHAFERYLYYETLIDGKEHWNPSPSICMPGQRPGRNWFGDYAHDLLFATCERTFQGGLKPGTHLVQMKAYLPGTDIQLASEIKKIEFNLNCPPN
ncbi:MAG: hypothetical protein AB7I41_04220 [Candidatus Sericytochromatia bacterium]